VIDSPCTAPSGCIAGLASDCRRASVAAVRTPSAWGVALPYIVAGFVPAVARLLPRRTVDGHAAPAASLPPCSPPWPAGLGVGSKAASRRGECSRCLSVGGNRWSADDALGRARAIIATFVIAYRVLTAAIGPNVRADPPTESANQGRWQTCRPSALSALAAEGGQTVSSTFHPRLVRHLPIHKATTRADTEVLASLRCHQVVLLRADLDTA